MTDLAWMDTQFFFQCFYLCIGCPGSFCYGWAFSSGWEQGLLSSCGVQASHWWLLLLQRTGSKRKGLSNWGTQDKLLRSLWNPPRSGSQPVSPALTGRFLSPATPGKSLNLQSCRNYFSSVQFSISVMSDSLQPHGLQHARLPWPSPTPRIYSNSCPSRWWCHPAISSSVVPFSSHLQSAPASGSFQMSQLFASDGQRIGVSASASVLPMNIQDWFALGLTGWISLQFKGLSRGFSNTTVQEYQFFGAQLSLYSNSHIYTWLLEKQ